jgi:hypothetical protein
MGLAVGWKCCCCLGQSSDKWGEWRRSFGDQGQPNTYTTTKKGNCYSCRAQVRAAQPEPHLVVLVLIKTNWACTFPRQEGLKAEFTFWRQGKSFSGSSLSTKHVKDGALQWLLATWGYLHLGWNSLQWTKIKIEFLGCINHALRHNSYMWLEVTVVDSTDKNISTSTERSTGQCWFRLIYVFY